MDLQFNSLADRVRYALRDFTSVGNKASFNVPVLTDETLYKMNPERYSFYMQLLDALQDPKSEVLDKILTVENKTRLARERMEDRLSNIGRNLRYLQLRNRKKTRPQIGGIKIEEIGSANPLESHAIVPADPIVNKKSMGNSSHILQDATAIHMNNTKELVDVDRDVVNMVMNETHNLQDATVIHMNKTKELGDVNREVENMVMNETNGNLAMFNRKLALEKESPFADEATAKPADSAVKGGGNEGEGSFYQQKLDEIEAIDSNKQQTAREKNKALNEVVEEVDTHPIYNPRFEKVSMTDRIIFISLTFILRGLSLFLIDWGLNSHMINSFNSAFLYYIIVYFCIFFVWIMLVNAGEDGKNLFFRMLFYYVNWDAHGPGRILVHSGVQLMLLPVPFVVKDRVVGKAPTWTYEQRRSTYRVLSNFTFFIWVLTSVIALRY
jgi:hypothetical protein